MGVLRPCIILIFCHLILAATSVAQSEYIYFIEREFAFHTDVPLTDLDPLIYKEFQEDSLYKKGIRKRIRIKSMLGVDYKSGDSIPLLRSRLFIENHEFRISGLWQNNHLTMGLKVNPKNEKVQLYFGDFQFDHGMGLVFASKSRFSSWTQDPHNKMYRERAFSTNASSDTLRYLRGGGGQVQLGNYRISGFFTESIEGLFIKARYDRIEWGGAIVNCKEGDHLIRFGPFVKFRTRMGIAYSELAVQMDGPVCADFGYSFLGNERTRFFAGYSFLSSGSNPYYTRHSFTKIRESDRQSLTLNVLHQIQRNWFFQSEFQSVVEGRSKFSKAYPQMNNTFRIMLKNQDISHLYSMIRLTLNQKGWRSQFRWRSYQGENSYLQLEFGLSDTGVSLTNYPSGYYFGFDSRSAILRDQLCIYSGISFYKVKSGGNFFYRYEPDLYYQMSLPIISGTGLRTYLKLRYRIFDQLNLELKFSRNVELDETPLSSSYRVKIQVIYSPFFEVQSF